MNKVGKNYIYNLIYQILTLIIPLITTPYISRVLSVDGIGIYSYTYSIAYFFAIIAELGTVTYARREIGFCQDDIEKRSKIFWEILIFRIITVVVSMVFYCIYMVKSGDFIIAFFQMFYILAVALDVTWFFQGVEEFKMVVIKNTIVKILTLLCIFIFIKNQSDLNKYIFILSFLPIVGNFTVWPSLKKYVKKTKISDLNPFSHFKGTMSLFIPTIAAQVYLLLDKTMLGVLTVDKAENGYYEQGQKIIKMCWTFLTTFSAVLSPRIAYYIAKKDKNNLKKYMRFSFRFIWIFSTAMCFGLIGIAQNVVPWFLGSAYDKVVTILIIFSFILIPIGVNGVTGTQYLVGKKKQTIYTCSIFAGAIVNFLLNIFLIKKYYSIGAAISSVIAEYIITLVQVIYIYKTSKDITLKDIFLDSWKCILSGIIMLITLIFLNNILLPSFVNTLILIIVGCSIYFICLLLLKCELIIDVCGKIKRRKINYKNKKMF